MAHLIVRLSRDEAGFIVSAELVMIATICVLALIVGLAEIATGVNKELEDVGSAVGSANQTFAFTGYVGHGGASSGSRFRDHYDFCDVECDIVRTGSQAERGKWDWDHHGWE